MLEDRASAGAARGPEDPATPVLEIEELEVAVGGTVPVVEDVSLRIERGEILALVGESGSGKSLTARSVMQLLPSGVTATGGRIAICGEEVLGASASDLRHVRGNKVGMIFQQPRSMLDPTCKVAPQVGESLRQHLGASRGAAWTRAVELLRAVGIPDPEQWARSYAHQLSGGMAQRVMIAAALSGDPELLIADEPTTALDVTVQAQILQLLESERRERNLSILLITHDLSVVSVMADRVAVMYAGSIVEQGPTEAVLKAPQHPYTVALTRCSLMGSDETGGFYSIPDAASLASDRGAGCRFHPRCRVASAEGLDEHCGSRMPAPSPSGEGHWVKCWASTGWTSPGEPPGEAH